MNTTETLTLVIAIAAGISVLLTLGIAIATFNSARAARYAAERTNKTIHGQIIIELLKEYSSSSMYDAAKVVRDWMDKNRKKSAGDFIMAITKELHFARRIIAHYFNKIYIIYKNDLIDEIILRDILTPIEIKFYRECVQPIDATIREYDPSNFDALCKLYYIPRDPKTEEVLQFLDKHPEKLV